MGNIRLCHFGGGQTLRNTRREHKGRNTRENRWRRTHGSVALRPDSPGEDEKRHPKGEHKGGDTRGEQKVKTGVENKAA